MRNDEFPEGASTWPEDLSRRDFIRLTGASLAFAGFVGCTKQPIEKIVPYAKQPPELVPGRPLRFASATTFNGYAQGILVTSREGRPIKIEGNPDHPASLGATTIWAQADLLDLYDPDRAQSVMRGENVSTWNDFLREVDITLQAQQGSGGAGLAILTQTITSPTLAAQLQGLQQQLPAMHWYQWDPLARDMINEVRSWEIYGEETFYDIAKAKVIVALDSDFLYDHPSALRHAREFVAARRIAGSSRPQMNRLYVAEPTPTITGSNADHRIAVSARDVRDLVLELGVLLQILPRGQELPAYLAHVSSWLQAASRELAQNRQTGILMIGHSQPAEIHALVHEINKGLQNIAHTISLRGPVRMQPPFQTADSLRGLVGRMNEGAVEALFILGGNPVYDSPSDFNFQSALQKVKLRVHHSLYANETAQKCHWHIPAAHFLETWSDARAFDGTPSIVQPLIEPLYGGISAHEFVDALLRRPARSSYEIVREHWARSAPEPTFEASRWAKQRDAGFEKRWHDSLRRGVMAEPLRTYPLPAVSISGTIMEKQKRDSTTLEVVFKPDSNVLDGRYANNGWLQELPRPFTKLTWENAALVSPMLAAREKIDTGDVVELKFHNRKVTAPVFVQLGQADNSVTLHLGYGRTEVGRVGKGAGFNAYVLRTSDALWFGDGLSIRKTGARHSLATTQHHHSMEGRDLLRSGTVAEFMSDSKRIAKPDEEPARVETLYNPDEFENRGYAWGMAIDLSACIGCNACTIACQAENNIPVVGKEQVARGREMHWIRIDTYESGKTDDPRFDHQPVPCMHCEHAPCELVCPVGATLHDSEGLNVQVYNRCVGTRYCSNNCPYKVRRFNFLEFNGALRPTEKLSKNPDVTVRSRGVMEKCTYCTQRINAARIAAELEERAIRDGEVVPACAQVCPTEAIVFGNMHDPNSRVSKLKRSPLNYSMLGELNTRPRTTYLAKLRNPNSDLE